MEILRNLARRKLRSVLTISGIVIGIFALTTMGAMAEHMNAKPDFVNHTFTVVGLTNKTQSLPDTVAWITTPDAQMLLKDSLPAAIQSNADTTQLTEGITAYGAPGAGLATLDAIAQRITDQ